MSTVDSIYATGPYQPSPDVGPGSAYNRSIQQLYELSEENVSAKLATGAALRQRVTPAERTFAPTAAVPTVRKAKQVINRSEDAYEPSIYAPTVSAPYATPQVPLANGAAVSSTTARTTATTLSPSLLSLLSLFDTSHHKYLLEMSVPLPELHYEALAATLHNTANVEYVSEKRTLTSCYSPAPLRRYLC